MTHTWRIKVADVHVARGAADFRIYQQNEQGLADIDLSGTFEQQPDTTHNHVQLRMVSQQDYAPLPELGRWQRARACSPDGVWSHTFCNVPAGGLYMIQTRLVWKNADGTEGARSGRIVRHLGVGDLWIIAGQSNSSGTGRGIAHDPPALGVHILQNNEVWQLAAHPLDDPSETDHPNRPGYPGTSPYLTFARLMQQALGYPIGLVQTAKGGSSLRMWHVEEDPAAPLWHNLIHCARLAGGKFRGLLWYQGCSDAGDGNSDNCRKYATRFRRWLELLRAEIGNLPVLLTQLNVRTDVAEPAHTDLGWSIVREAHRQLGTDPGCYVVPAINAPMSDGIHNGSTGNVIIGERLARAALAELFGKPLLWKSPNAASAKRSDDGSTVEVAFADVSSQLIFLWRGLNDFRIEDSAGLVPVTKATCAGDTVKLTLQRPLSGKATVSGGYGYAAHVSLYDYETNLPMLCFHGLEIA